MTRLPLRSLLFLAVCFSLGYGAPAMAAATVQGRVFIDHDRNGRAESAEPGIAGVAVSDGRNVVLTTANGVYQLDVAAGAPFVFVTLPRGYRALAGRFYLDAKASGPLDFALVDWPESQRDDIRLVQISDTHVTEARESVRTFAEDAKEINALDPRPAFVLATGDLVNRGNQAPQYEAYVEAIAHFELPLFNLPGNHDTNSREGLQHYHRYLGPDCYSFNAGNCHFVLLDFFRIRDAGVQDWIKQDLAAAPKGATVIFAMHALPTEEQLKHFGSLGAKAVLSGHWHGHRVQKSGSIADLNTPPMRFGGIDRHPRGFRIVEIANGNVRNELRLGGFRQHGVVVAPAGPILAPPGKLPIIVNAYDSRFAVAAVECDVAGERVTLRKTSHWTWSGEARVPEVSASVQRVVATIRGTNGETWRAESTFQVERPATTAALASESRSPLRLKWSAPTGGVIGFSSPRVGPHGVAIGVDDPGDLKSCGVATFDFEGRRRWHFNTDSAIKNTVAISNGRIFATSVAGWLYALDEATGKLAWKAALGRHNARWEVTATTVANGVVHVGSYHHIAAFDEKTGHQLWATKVGPDGDWRPSSYTIPTIAQGKLLLFHLRYGAFALDARSGELAWKLDGDVHGCAVNGDTIYTVRNNAPIALALQTGQVLWTGTAKIGGTASHPLWAGDRIVVGTADGRVCALSPQDGSVLWSSQTDKSLTSLQPYARGGSDVNSSPALHNGVVYVGASDGQLHALALADGAKLGTYRLGVPIASSPVIADGTLYVGGYDGNVYAFNVRD
jgi:outer membrane protein assembly factor BamB